VTFHTFLPFSPSATMRQAYETCSRPDTSLAHRSSNIALAAERLSSHHSFTLCCVPFPLCFYIFILIFRVIFISFYCALFYLLTLTFIFSSNTLTLFYTCFFFIHPPSTLVQLNWLSSRVLIPTSRETYNSASTLQVGFLFGLDS
jgi:hypothetical protein